MPLPLLDNCPCSALEKTLAWNDNEGWAAGGWSHLDEELNAKVKAVGVGRPDRPLVVTHIAHQRLPVPAFRNSPGQACFPTPYRWVGSVTGGATESWAPGHLPLLD